VAAWWCADRSAATGRRASLAGAGLLALAATWASPVAGAFLALAVAARALTGGRPELPAALALCLPVLTGGAALTLLFPEGGTDRFVATAFWPMLAVSVGSVVLLGQERRGVRTGAVLYLLALVGAFVVPTPFGQNALRLGVLLGPALLVFAARPGAPRAALAVALAALVYLQWLPAVRAVAEAEGDPSTQPAFHAEAAAALARLRRPGERVEAVFTRNHWEAAYLARTVPLARGWERQLDQKVNPLFYAEHGALTAGRYHAWLRENAVRWVALPAAPLDYSALREAALLRRGAPYLRLAYHSPRWSIWEVRDAEPPATDGARVLATRPDGFDLVASRPTVVRQRWTRYWHAAGACLSATPGGWTRVAPRDPHGTIHVRASFGGAAPRCATPPAVAAR
jgi:hypothetical protein